MEKSTAINAHAWCNESNRKRYVCYEIDEHCVPEKDVQDVDHHNDALKTEIVKPLQRQVTMSHEFRRAVDEYMLWCDLAISVAIRQGKTHCHFEINPILNSFLAFDCDKLLNEIILVIRSSVYYRVHVVNCSTRKSMIIISWSIDYGAMTNKSAEVIDIDVNLNSMPSKECMLDTFAKHDTQSPSPPI
jgi:hypothetical protein